MLGRSKISKYFKILGFVEAAFLLSIFLIFLIPGLKASIRLVLPSSFPLTLLLLVIQMVIILMAMIFSKIKILTNLALMGLSLLLSFFIAEIVCLL